MNKLFKPTQITAAIAVVLASPTVFANTSTVATLDPIVVTASRTAEKASKVPAATNVITSSQISQNPALNVSDVVQHDASVYVKQSGGIGQVPAISLRGTDPKHTLLLKDGARLNTQNELSPVYPGFLDTTDIERIEILKGPASVQYGSDAIGGVVQLVSKTPTKNGAFVTGLYGENDTYKVVAGADVVSHNGFYAQVRGQRLETDGTRIFENQLQQDKASYDQKGYAAKVGYDNQEDGVKFGASISQNEGVNIFSADYKTNNAPREFENRVISLDGQITGSQVDVNARFSNVQDKQNLPAYDSYYNTESKEFDINVKRKFTENANLLLGTTFNRSDFESNSITEGQQSVNSYGYYAQYQYNDHNLNTQIGVRAEDHDTFGTHVVGQSALRYHVTPSTSVYANIGSAFRAPTLNELYSQWGGNVDLQPEESVSYELGLEQKITQNLVANISAYRTNIDNLIVYVYNNNMYRNIAEATFTGGEVGLKWAKDDYFASAQYAFVETENKATGTYIAYRPRHSATFTAGFENEKMGLNTSVIARSKANTDTSTKVPGYATIDVNAFYNVHPNVKVFANIQNAANKEYKAVYHSPENWYVNGGRQTNLGVTFRY